MKTLFTNLEEVGARLIDNTQLRNVRIISYYECLQDIDPEMLFSEKTNILAWKFGIAAKSIDRVICQYTKKK